MMLAGGGKHLLLHPPSSGSLILASISHDCQLALMCPAVLRGDCSAPGTTRPSSPTARGTDNLASKYYQMLEIFLQVRGPREGEPHQCAPHPLLPHSTHLPHHLLHLHHLQHTPSWPALLSGPHHSPAPLPRRLPPPGTNTKYLYKSCYNGNFCF